MVGPVGLVGLLQDLKTMAGTDAISKEELEALKKQWLEEMKANMKVTTQKFVDSYTLNLDPDPEFGPNLDPNPAVGLNLDPDPQVGPNLEPDLDPGPDPYPDPGLFYQF